MYHLMGKCNCVYFYFKIVSEAGRSQEEEGIPTLSMKPDAGIALGVWQPGGKLPPLRRLSHIWLHVLLGGLDIGSHVISIHIAWRWSHSHCKGLYSRWSSLGLHLSGSLQR